MGIFNRKAELMAKIMDQELQLQTLIKQNKTAQMWLNNSSSGTVFVRNLNFDGEKTLGGIGPVVNRVPDYYLLSTRSWDAYKTDKVAQTVINRYVDWIIDKGLRLKANPNIIVLGTENIVMDKNSREKFNDIVESRWSVWGSLKESSHSENLTFPESLKEIYKHALVGGDNLVVLRLNEYNIPTVQMIDGARICSPLDTTLSLDEGIRVVNGVKMNSKGKHLGYYVRKSYLSIGKIEDFDYIEAYNEFGIRTAFMVSGTKWRCDFGRGLPVIGSVLETLSKLDRYSEASVANAEEIANIVYQVVHRSDSNGQSPMIDAFAKSFNVGTTDDTSGINPIDLAGNQLANKISVSTERRAFNNPIGAEIKTLDHGNNLTGFKEFFEPHSQLVCACVGIPPNVAFQLYNDSFSASRAATKDWDHTMDVRRFFFSEECLNHVYAFWLWIQVLQSKVSAPGYLKAINDKNYMVKKAYETCAFTGSHFPHIDPLKEVNAVRKMLGSKGDEINLITVEDGTDMLGNGDSDSNMEQFADEIEIAQQLKIISPPENNTQN